MRKPPKRPYHKNRLSKPSSPKYQTNLLTKSHRTGLEITWGNVAGWEKIMNGLEARAKVEAPHILSSLEFESWLENQTIQNDDICASCEFGYRFANPAYGPLTIVGSISDGGRYNIGGAQIRGEFPNLTKQGCLYLSSTTNCAREESAIPYGENKMYKVSLKFRPNLWDLNKIIDKLGYPDLLNIVKQAQGEKIWAYQKYPSISQVLGAKLRKIGGDGIIFRSTKIESDFNIALFFKTDDEAKEKLNFEEVSIP